MPNRYEREIEEILRNIDQTEPKQGLGDRLRAFNRPRPAPVRRRPSLSLTRTELLLLLGIALALASAGVAYYRNSPDIMSFVLGVLAFITIAWALGAEWWTRYRGPQSGRNWRGNVVDMTPHHHNPFGGVVTRFRILRLKLRYRRSRRDIE